MPYTGGVEIFPRNCPEIIETRGLGAVESVGRIRTGSVEISEPTAGVAEEAVKHVVTIQLKSGDQAQVIEAYRNSALG